MQLKNLNNLLNTWGKYVIQQSRTYLTKAKKNNTKKLYDSLDYEITLTDEFAQLTFLMEDYGAYQDAGVFGADPTLVKDGIQKGQTTNSVLLGNKSRFSYTTKRPPSDTIAQWAKARNFRLRDEKGRFAKGNYKSIGFVLSRSIFAQGIAPSLFFTKAYNNSVARYADKLADDLGNDFLNNL